MYELAPSALKLADWPEQIAVLPLIANVGVGNNGIVITELVLQPLFPRAIAVNVGFALVTKAVTLLLYCPVDPHFI